MFVKVLFLFLFVRVFFYDSFFSFPLCRSASMGVSMLQLACGKTWL
jgi:hypothetical protein